MKYSRSFLATLTAFGLLVIGAGHAPAQEQPDAATNAQDEVVNVLKTVGPDAADLTIFRTGDKAEKNNYISEVIELKNAAAFELIPHVLRAVRLERGAARSLKYTMPGTDPKQVRYFIQVVTTRDQMPSVLDTIRALDLPGVVSSEGDLKYHYRLQYRRASEVAAILDDTVLSGEGSVAFDDATNTIYIKDSQSDGLRDIETIKFYDVPPPMVEFEVTAVEIEEDNSGELGVDWDFWKEALGGQFDVTFNRFEGGEDFARLDALLTVDARALASFLNYTVSNGTAKVNTRTLLTASNDTPAVFSSLKRLSSAGYVTAYGSPSGLYEVTPRVDAYDTRTREEEAQSRRPVTIVPPSRSTLVRTSGDPANPGAAALDPSLRSGEKSEGMFLVIRPTIGRSMVTANIRCVLNSLAGTNDFGEPIISERLVDTRVTLRNGEPFVIGGLGRETDQKVRRGIPLLKDIPVVRYLFSVESTRKAATRVYLIIKPKFNSQVLFVSPGLKSKDPDIVPPNVINEALEPATVPPGSPSYTELLHKD